jgi:DNA mismatch repair protein MutS2
VAIGDRVLVGPFGMEGVVKTLNDRDAEVDIRGKRMRALVGDLRIVAGAPMSPARVQVNVELQPREGSLTELNVIGCNVDEALTRAGKFLDEALMSELKSVRVIHGYGTGQLRRAIAGFLQNHPLVANFSSAPAEQGGGGVTLVELKD